MSKQINDRKRVVEYGEVFTREREVKAMCDLVQDACERVDSRFLEPACGNGNFLAEILNRKLARVKKMHNNNPYDYERYAILAVSSIYGIDILSDNAQGCRNRLYEIWNNEYQSVCRKNCSDQTKNAARYILSQNILCGNALTMMQVDEYQQDTEMPVIFPEWSLIMGTRLKRRDFRFDVIVKANSKLANHTQAKMLDAELAQYLSINPMTGEYMPEPIKEYPAVHYKKIMEVK